MNKEIISFGAGCFWGVEDAFTKIDGVLETQVGYQGGTLQNPSYKQVCTGTTSHAEVCRVTFNSDKLSLEELLKFFWKMHDPTRLNAQNFDIGTQYRSAIFCMTEKQLEITQKSKQAISKDYQKPIVTEIKIDSDFWLAEEYHQKYHLKNGGSCSF